MPSLRGSVTAIAAMGALTAMLAGTLQAQDKPTRGGTIKSISSGYRTLNPGVQSGAATAMPGAQLFAGLVEIGENYKPIPYLAESWTVSDGGKTHTFKLAKGATFHDGKPITSADVAFSMAVVKKHHPFGPIMHASLSTVETPDARTIVFKHAQAVPYFMQTLAPHLMPVMPKHVYDDGKNMKTHPRNMQNVVGSGPFKMVEHKTGQYLILARHDGFVRKGRPYADKVILTIQKDPATRRLSFEKGEANYFPFTGFSERDIKRLEKRKGIKLDPKGYEAMGQTNYLELNLRKKPFDDVRVRQALAHAIDNEFISKTLFLGVQKPAYGIVHTTNPLYSPTSPKFQGGIAKANELLDAAGLKRGANGTRFKMTIDLPNWGVTYLHVMADYLRPHFKKIGVEVSLRKAPDFGTWAKRVSKWEYQATFNAVWNYPDPAIGIHRLFSCKNIRNQVWTNTQGYCNEKIDALMSKAAVTVDAAERKKAYAEFSRITSEEQVMLFLTYQSNHTGQHDFVKNTPSGVWGGLGPWDGIYMKK